MAGEILKPAALVLPKFTTVKINLLTGPIGSIVFDTDKAKISFCISKTAGAASWEDVTSA